MDKRSTQLISQNARLLWDQEDSALLRGVLLSAWRVIQELKLTSEESPMRAKEIAQALQRKYAYVASPESVRQLVQALRSGGIAIQSNTSRGYSIDWGSEIF